MQREGFIHLFLVLPKRNGGQAGMSEVRGGSQGSSPAQLCDLGQAITLPGDLLGRTRTRRSGKGLGWQGHEVGCTRRR